MKNTTIKALIKIKNASIIVKNEVSINFNEFSLCIIRLLYKSGLIQNYKLDSKNSILIKLRIIYNKILTKNIKVISTPSKVIFLPYKDLIFVNSIIKTLFLSTSKGLLSLADCKKQKIGGTLLFLC